jgi:hypothetical protein
MLRASTRPSRPCAADREAHRRLDYDLWRTRMTADLSGVKRIEFEAA